MDIYLQVSDEKHKTLTLDGDLELLDRLLATIKAGHHDEHGPLPTDAQPIMPRVAGVQCDARS